MRGREGGSERGREGVWEGGRECERECGREGGSVVHCIELRNIILHDVIYISVT